jgi:hypothetical protein
MQAEWRFTSNRDYSALSPECLPKTAVTVTRGFYLDSKVNLVLKQAYSLIA